MKPGNIRKTKQTNAKKKRCRLYNNGELVVPGTGSKHCSVQTFCSPIPATMTNYWDGLDDKDPGGEKKSILYVFEAHRDAVTAFQYSIPVISLDASFIKCPRTTAVLMTASFKTTDGHLLTMTYGTAPSETIESWCFFVINLRQVLKKYCKDVNIWNNISFISDRNPGILTGVRKHFPEAHHLYCAVHILRNVQVKGIDVYQYWLAVEAPNRDFFDDACTRAQTSKLLKLKDDAAHWSRFAIRETGCRRYGFRTNNNAESQNNALRNLRRGPVMLVLYEAFCYTARKVSDFRLIAAKYRQTGGNYFTNEAIKVYRSNMAMAKNCTIEVKSSTSYTVTEFGMKFRVDIEDENNSVALVIAIMMKKLLASIYLKL